MRAASIIIEEAVSSWPGVTSHPHRFGGREYRMGKRELGHVHGNSLVDIPFPMKVRNQLIAEGIVQRHHVLPESGWVSFSIRQEGDAYKAIELLRMSYDLATKQKI
ncbi:MAG: DUF5519 family protein [Ignavibacteriales bacterium]|nr:DUF5519 family protein [Ignavibacteriales bacterium]